MHVCACDVYLCACMLLSCHLFSAWERTVSKQKLAVWESEKERKRGRKRKGNREKEKGRWGGRRKEKKQKTKRSNDRLVARIGFRTVSNDTGQDARPPQRWSRESLLLLWTFSLLPTLTSRSGSGWDCGGDSRGSQVAREWREHRELRDQRRITRLRVCLVPRNLVPRRNIPRNLFPLGCTRAPECVTKFTREPRCAGNSDSNETFRSYVGSRGISRNIPFLSKIISSSISTRKRGIAHKNAETLNRQFKWHLFYYVFGHPEMSVSTNNRAYQESPKKVGHVCDPPRTHAGPHVIVNLRGCGRDVLAWPHDRVLKDSFVGPWLIDRYIRTDVNISWVWQSGRFFLIYPRIVSSFRQIRRNQRVSYTCDLT